ncbi:hypothetical protein IQ269_22335 [Tychonema sp. LEGE 07199]|uniref:hypothetical protein n=1 Tax=unclassified Tychonema TaxID=2642144 RepID=UPI0018819D66|nr:MULTISPECIES: hypothetical protein [unclassified Tychonema]MBE9123460.1 hypothetical protein [Tychonema sp. LEGE 07199]MBE9132364.1 hypothetical protein [Tychonema sp. LEGE 07196]
MYPLNRWKKRPGILQIISGSLLIALPTAPLVASAAPAPTLNSCPRIYYEEPFSTNVRVPQGCRPNAANQRLNQQELGQNMVPPARRTNVTQPPLPEARQTPIATVMPMAGKVSVKLTNSTNTPISYQAIGHTESRMLARGAEIVLQNLPTPVTVTMVRADGGLLKVIPMSSSEEGMLAVSIDETSNFDGNQGVLRIQPDGQVFLN